jgi:hypothetical protein
VVVRARRVQGRSDDTVVKPRRIVPGALPPSLRKAKTMVVEVDAMPGGYICSASFKGASAPATPSSIGQFTRMRDVVNHRNGWYTDHQVGRLVDALQDLGILGDTLVLYMVGDNGASAEGTLNGTFNEMINFNGAAVIETPEFMIARLDDFGGPDSYNHYAVGRAHAMDTTYQWTKQVASH